MKLESASNVIKTIERKLGARGKLSLSLLQQVVRKC